jgi:hypothetical protein
MLGKQLLIHFAIPVEISSCEEKTVFLINLSLFSCTAKNYIWALGNVMPASFSTLLKLRGVEPLGAYQQKKEMVAHVSSRLRGAGPARCGPARRL